MYMHRTSWPLCSSVVKNIDISIGIDTEKSEMVPILITYQYRYQLRVLALSLFFSLSNTPGAWCALIYAFHVWFPPLISFAPVKLMFDLMSVWVKSPQQSLRVMHVCISILHNAPCMSMIHSSHSLLLNVVNVKKMASVKFAFMSLWSMIICE